MSLEDFPHTRRQLQLVRDYVHGALPYEDFAWDFEEAWNAEIGSGHQVGPPLSAWLEAVFWDLETFLDTDQCHPETFDDAALKAALDGRLAELAADHVIDQTFPGEPG